MKGHPNGMMHLKNKKVLVTGGTGFIGLNIVKGLLNRGFTNIFVTTHTDRPYYYDDLLSRDAVTTIKCDLTNKQECLKATKDIDFLILASAVSFGASFIQDNPLGLVNDNIVMNVHLLDSCKINGVEKVIYFGSTTGYPDTDESMREEDMFKGDPFERYFSVGWMKRYTEVLLRLYAEKLGIMDCTALRLTNVYGPYDKYDLETSHVLPAMVRKFCEKRFPLEIWGDGEDSRDLIHVDDVVEAVVRSLDCEGFNAYNLGAGRNHTVNEIVSLLCDIHGVTPEITYVKNKPKMIKKRTVCVDKIKRDLSFSPSIGIRQGLENTVDWLSSNISAIYR